MFFSFTGEADIQSWGWKVLIETEIEKETSVHWAHHLKVASNFLVVFFSKSLISGDFSSRSEQEVEAEKVLKNPLFKFGIKDKCQSFLLPDKKQTINEGLIDLSLIPGSFEAFNPHLTRSSSSVVERIRKSSFPGYKANDINSVLNLSSYISNYNNNYVTMASFSENPVIDE